MINAFVIEWKGPYTDPKEITENNLIYLITGNLPQGPAAEKIRYIGITTSNPAMRFNGNHKFWNLSKDTRKIWIGKINFGTIQRYSDAEWLLVHYLNSQKNNPEIKLKNIRKINDPKNSICIINRWYKACDGDEYMNCIFPFKHIPDMIYWDAFKKRLVKSDKICIERE